MSVRVVFSLSEAQSKNCIESFLEHENFSIQIFSCLENSLEVTLFRSFPPLKKIGVSGIELTKFRMGKIMLF